MINPFVPQFVYLLIPAAQPKGPAPFLFSFLEQGFAMNARNIPVERQDFINGDRVYRIDVQYLFRFPSDTNGSFVRMPDGKLQYFVTSEPDLAVLPIREWNPVV